MLKKLLEDECKKIPLKCKHMTCLFEVTECNSKFYWDWLNEKRAECPKCCPKFKEKKA